MSCNVKCMSLYYPVGGLPGLYLDKMGGRLLGEGEQCAADEGNMAFLHEEDVAWWGGPCQGP